MSVRRLAILIVLPTVIAVAAAAGAAGATVNATLKLAPHLGPPTTVTKATGTGFKPGETVDLSFDGSLVARATVKTNGSFAKLFTVPKAAQPGSHGVRAQGESSGVQASAPFLVRTPWAQFRFDEGHDGLNPYENTISPSNAGNLINGWTWHANGAVLSSPTYFNGLVIEGSNDHKVRAITASTGKVAWTWTLDGAIPGSPAEACSPPDPCRVFVATNASVGSVYAADTKGKQAWHVTMGAPVSFSPALACVPPPCKQHCFPPPCEEQLVVGDGQGIVRGLDPHDGHVLWSTSVAGAPFVPADLGAQGPPDPERVFVTTDAGNVYALSVQDGSVQWSAHVGGIPTSPAATHGFNPQPDPPGYGEVVVATDQGMVYEFNGETGHLDRSFGLAGPTSRIPALGDVNGDGSSDIVVGEKSSLNGAPSTPGPTAVELQAFNVDGSQIWAADLGVSVLGAPSLANGLVWLGLEDGSLRAYRSSDGAKMFSFTIKGPVRTSPMIADGRVVVGSNDQSIDEFQLPG